MLIMKTLFFSFRPGTLFLTLGLLFFSVSTTMQSCAATFDQVGLDNITNLGGRLTDLMAKAKEPYGKHADAVGKLMTELGQAADHAATQKKNMEIANSWNILKNDLAMPFFDRWKEKGVLGNDYIKEAVGQVGKSIDAIKKAELAKKK